VNERASGQASERQATSHRGDKSELYLCSMRDGLKSVAGDLETMMAEDGEDDKAVSKRSEC